MYLLHSAEISPDPVIQSAVYEERNNYTCQGITFIIHSQLCTVQVIAQLVFMAPPQHSLIEKQGCIMPTKVDIPEDYVPSWFIAAMVAVVPISGGLIAVSRKKNHTNKEAPVRAVHPLHFDFYYEKMKRICPTSLCYVS